MKSDYIIVSVKDGQVFIENKATGLGALEVTRIERVEKAGEPYSIIFKMPVSVQKMAWARHKSRQQWKFTVSFLKLSV